jgi:hypothetical protein
MDRLMYHIYHLPSSIRTQVIDYIEYLLAKYRKKQVNQPIEKKYPLRGSVSFYNQPFDSAEDE